MPNRFGAVAHMGNPFTPRSLNIAPVRENIHDYATIQSMKRGSRRESFRSLPDTISIGNRSYPAKWVA